LGLSASSVAVIGESTTVKRLAAILFVLLGILPVHGSEARHAGVAHQPTRPLSESVNDFPRLANIYALTTPDHPDTFARYGIVIAARAARASGAVQAIKAANASTKIIFYENTSTVDLSDIPSMDIYPGWWLTLVGTRLTAGISADATIIPVTKAVVIQHFLATNPDVLVDNETMHVLSVDTVHNTLTVQRGYYSTAAAHTRHARIAAHASKWPHSWMLNVTPYCPTNPTTGQTWVGYAAHLTQIEMNSAPWDGVLWDDGNTSFAHISSGQLDADNNNIADGGNGPSGVGWAEGVKRLLALSRALIPGKLQLVTDAYYPGLMNGQEMEHFPFYADGWTAGFDAYLQQAGPSRAAPYTIINADTANSNDSVDTGEQNLQQMRFNLATTLMGNGYFVYDYGPKLHGQTWWYDEYDKGAGSSLATAIDTTQTTVQLAPHSGNKFQIGDIVHVPEDIHTGGVADGLDDEQMLVIGVTGDRLTVQRGYNKSLAAPHPALSKVLTQEQIRAGLGWLGQPRTDATPLPLTSPSLVVNADFGRRGATWLNPWMLQLAAPAVVRISQDRHTAVGDGVSAKIEISRATPGTSWNAALIQQDTPALRLTAGTAYTLSFWAKGSAGEILGAGIRQAGTPWLGRVYRTFVLTDQWQRYTETFTAPATESIVKMQFDLAEAPGVIWLDRVGFREGDPNLWRRDFTHGTVLLNATYKSQTVTLGKGYQRIAGTQDPVTNSGNPASTITIPPQDAVLLVKTP